MLGLIKPVFQLGCSIGAGVIVSNAVKHVTPWSASTVVKVASVFGEFALSGIAADAAAKWVDKTFEQLFPEKK